MTFHIRIAWGRLYVIKDEILSKNVFWKYDWADENFNNFHRHKENHLKKDGFDFYEARYWFFVLPVNFSFIFILDFCSACQCLAWCKPKTLVRKFSARKKSSILKPSMAPWWKLQTKNLLYGRPVKHSPSQVGKKKESVLALKLV